jgi:hypothetical protein
MLVVGALSSSPRVHLEVGDDRLAGALALAFVDDGIVVVAHPDEASHTLIVAARGAGLSITCVGAESLHDEVAPGPAALVVLDARQRAVVLLRRTPPRDAAVAGDVVEPALLDRGGDGHLVEDVAGALLSSGVGLAPGDVAVERLCLEAGADEVSLGWQGPRRVCAEGVRLGFARTPDAGARLVAEALRLRGHRRRATALQADGFEERGLGVDSGPRSGGGRGDQRALLRVGAGASSRTSTLDPRIDLSVAIPLGDRLSVAGVVAAAGSADPVPIAEGMLAVGPSLRLWRSSALQVRAALLGGAWLHGWRWSGADAGLAIDGVLAVPVGLELAIADGLAIGVETTVGATSRSWSHRIGDRISWERSAFFSAISVGFTIGVPASAGAEEKERPLVRGETNDEDAAGIARRGSADAL